MKSDQHKERALSTHKLRSIIAIFHEVQGDCNTELIEKLSNHFQNLDRKKRYMLVRFLSRKKNKSLLPFYSIALERERDTTVRRELVSAIGRLRLPEVIPLLVQILNDPDPKVVLQAVRGIAYFEEVRCSALLPLREHPNELIRAAVEDFLSGKKHTSSSKSKKTSNLSHTYVLPRLRNVMILGDALSVISNLPDDSVHLTFTSPPYYNARDYTLYRSYEDYLNFLTEVFSHVHRVTKEGRFFILNTSPIIIPRMSRQHASKRYAIPFDLHSRIVQLGFEFVDDIIWVKPAPSAKNRNGVFYQNRKPLSYKANSITEYVMVYRKATKKLIDWNIRQYPANIVEESKVTGPYEPTNVWNIAPSSDQAHPAVFPLELASRVVSLYSYKGDLVLDPFAGRGTTGKAAIMLERYFLMIEKEKKYYDYAKDFIGTDNLFKVAQPITFLEQSQFFEVINF